MAAPGTWNIEEAARLGLPPGQYIVRIDTIESGMTASQPPMAKLQFTALLAQPTGTIPAGKKHVWSYTIPKGLGFLGKDLMACEIKGDAPLDPRALTEWLLPQMRGGFFVLGITAQKSDPAYTNTQIVSRYAAPGMTAPAAAPVAVAAPVAAAPPPVAAVTAPPPASVVPPAAPPPVAATPPPVAAPPPLAAPVENGLPPLPALDASTAFAQV